LKTLRVIIAMSVRHAGSKVNSRLVERLEWRQTDLPCYTVAAPNLDELLVRPTRHSRSHGESSGRFLWSRWSEPNRLPPCSIAQMHRVMNFSTV
jgi:hypothetical protein